MVRRSNLTIMFILLLISTIWIGEFVLAFDDVHKIPEPEKFTEMQLTEELNLSGETLRELMGENPRLVGLKEITAKVYELLDFEWDYQKVESILEFYHDNLKTQGWRMMLWKISENKATLNLVLEKDGGREGLFIVQLTPKELTLIKLIGQFNLGALNELRSALRAEWQLDTLRPLPTEKKPLSQELFSPSKMTEPRYFGVDHLEQAIEEGKTYADVYAYLGIAYERNANFEKAQEQYQTILDKFPDAPDWILARALYGVGKCSEQLGEIERAKQSYTNFIDEFDSENYFAPAVESGLIRLQRYGGAVLFKKNEIARGCLAKAEDQLYNRWAYEDAIETYNSIVRKFPTGPYAASAQFMKGICYRWMNKPQFEIEELQKAVEKYPNAAACYYLGRAYHRRDMYQDALNQYQKIVDEYPESNRQYIADADYNIGKCLEGLDRTDEASEHYERFLEKYKNDKEQGYLYSSARIALEILKRNSDTLPFLGVGLRRIDGKVVVTRIIEGSAAEHAGIQKGDVILSVDGAEIQYPKGVVAAVISKDIGDTVVVTIMRGNQQLDISATLGKK